MDFKALKWLLLFVIVMAQAGCATQEYDPANDLQPATSTHDESHGWGGNFSAGSH